MFYFGLTNNHNSTSQWKQPVPKPKQTPRSLHLGYLPLDLVTGLSFLGPKCVIDLLQFLLEFCEFEAEDCGEFVLLYGPEFCLIVFLFGVEACKTGFWTGWFCSLGLRGLDRVSKRDIETALPGLRSIRFPGVLDREYPFPVPPCTPAGWPAGEAVEKVMVGIKSVRRRWAEAEPEFEFEWWNVVSPSATNK